MKLHIYLNLLILTVLNKRKEKHMEQNLPKIYVINEDGTEQLLLTNKLKFEYETGAKITVEVNKRDTHEIVLRGYHGAQEYERSKKGLTLNVRPGGCNLIRISHELYDISRTVE